MWRRIPFVWLGGPILVTLTYPSSLPSCFCLTHLFPLFSLHRTHTILYTDSIFPTFYLVLTLVTMLYGKRGRDLCSSMNVQQHNCQDIKGLAVLPIFVEMVC